MNIFYYLGSIYFALFLIAATALFVVLGTFLESYTQSHLYAAYFTYSNPIFICLLWGFFVNILFSTLRRWPFKKHHIPFILTHLGLLMILGGQLVKHYYGVQGTMVLTEGSGSHEIFIPNTYALYLEKKDPAEPFYNIGESTLLTPRMSIQGVDIKLLGYAKNSSERYVSWIKQHQGSISGISPFPIGQKIPVAFENHEKPWHVIALESQAITTTAEQIYLENFYLTITDRLNEKILWHGLLKDAITEFSGKFDLEVLKLHYAKYEVLIPLQGPEALSNINASFTHLGVLPFSFDLNCENPILSLIEDPSHQIGIFAFDPYGRIFEERYSADTPRNVLSYDRGYGGYTVQFLLPSLKYSYTRKECESECRETLAKLLQKSENLAPPLQLFKKACQQSDQDFSENCLHFFDLWARSHNWSVENEIVHSLDKSLQSLNWGDGKPKSRSSVSNARLLSAYMMLHGISPELLFKIQSLNPRDITLETSLLPVYEQISPSNQLEENKPHIVLKASTSSENNIISLAYDRYAQGIKWPCFEGKHVIRFQPLIQKIPYRLRLRTATQINYPNSTQPFSYECNLLITDLTNGQKKEADLSMNHVYETEDGYRFYLANIAPADESAIKRVQIVVNRDPAKYLLTYPGAGLLSIGIVLLFWLWPYKR